MSITSPNGGRPDPGERGRRWQLDDAIEASGLPPLTRHALHALLRRADVPTGEIPDKYQPSLAALQKQTGMRHEVLLRELNRAEDTGWLRRNRGGGRGHRTKYTVVQPETGPAPGPVQHPETSPAPGPVQHAETSPAPGLDSDRNWSGCRTTETGPAPGPQLDQRTRSDLSLGRLLADRLPEVAEEEREKLAQRIIETNTPRNERPYLRKLPEADVLAELEAMRSEAAASNGHSAPATKQIVEQLRQGPPCEHGESGGASLHPDSGRPLCALCRAGVL